MALFTLSVLALACARALAVDQLPLAFERVQDLSDGQLAANTDENCKYILLLSYCARY